MLLVLLLLKKKDIYFRYIKKWENIKVNNLNNINEGKFPISSNPQFFFILKKKSWFKYVFKTKLFLGYPFMVI